MSILLLFPVLLPLLAGAAVCFIPVFDNAKVRRITTIAVLCATIVLLLPVFFAGEQTLTLFTLSDNLPIFLHTDMIGLSFAALMSFVWGTAGIYSFPCLAHEGGERRYYALYLATLGALMGLCFSGSIITFYMFFEGMTLLTMPMVMHSGKKDAVAAGIKYLIYSVLGASLVLLGVFVLAPYVKSFSFAAGGALDMTKVAGHEGLVLTFSFLMLVGFSAKAGLFPLHGWLPTAHPAAPSPASAVLSGVITKAGVLGVLRLIFYYLGVDFLRGTWVQTAYMCLTLLTIFTGSLLAYHEGHLKKRLAWSSVSQVSYVLFGLSTMNPVGLVGALLHAIAHSLAKDTLFMSAGAIILKTEKTQVADLRGIGKQMPVTMACFTVASLGLVGIPPCMGFVSKWYLAQGSLAATGVSATLNIVGPVILLISALLTAGYLFPIVIRGFIVGNGGHGHDAEPAPVYERNDAPWMMLIPLLVLSVLSVLIGMFPGALIDLVTKVGTALM